MRDKKISGEKQDRMMSRRDFMGTAAAAAAFTIVPRSVLGGSGSVAPSDKLNIACIGIGGMGATDVRAVETENIVALCDVDWKHAAAAFKRYPAAKKYKDFRKMLEAEEKNIDAVMVSTPQTIDEKEQRVLRLSDEAVDLLLFQMLQELLYFKDAEQLLLRVREVSIEKKDNRYMLSAWAVGEAIDVKRHDLIVDVKAVTLHRFEVAQTEQGWQATVILDV